MATQGFAWALHQLQILPENLCKCLVVCANLLPLLLVLPQLNSITQANSFSMGSGVSRETVVTAVSVEQSNPGKYTSGVWGFISANEQKRS